MREILFRGKRIENDEWVYGLPYETEHIDSLRVREDHGDFISHTTYKVIPETVGQFTGLCDKNGTKIFDGDILMDGDSKYLVKYSPFSCGFHAEGFDREGIWSLYHLCHGGNQGKAIEVIGTIHDKPELLKG